MAQKRKKPVRRKPLRGTVTPSREPAAIGWVCCAVFVVVLILCILNHTDRNTCLCIGGMILLTIPLMMTVNIRIDYDERTGFVCRNLFGIKKQYKWQDITGIRAVRSRSYHKWHDGTPYDTVIELGSKHIRVHWDSQNSAVFLSIARQYAARKEGA